jgi:hypothetical protein
VQSDCCLSTIRWNILTAYSGLFCDESLIITYQDARSHMTVHRSDILKSHNVCVY